MQLPKKARRAPSREEVPPINTDALRGRRGVRRRETATITAPGQDAEDGRVQSTVPLRRLRLLAAAGARDRPHRSGRLERFRRFVEVASFMQAVSPTENEGPKAYDPGLHQEGETGGSRREGR